MRKFSSRRYLAAALKRIRNKQNRTADSADGNRKKTADDPAVADGIATLKAHDASILQRGVTNDEQDKSEHTLNERRMTDATVGLHRATISLRNFTVALVVIAIISAVVSALQWWEIHSGSSDTHALAEAAQKQADTAARQIIVMQGQWDVMRVERRAWITNEGLKGHGDFVFGGLDGFEPVIPISINIAVTGESPAQDVIGRSLIIPTRTGIDLIKIQRNYCNKVAKIKITKLEPFFNGGYVFQRTIGPGHQQDITVIVEGDGNEFAKIYSLNSKFGSGGYIDPVAIGCVIYRIADGSTHWTGFIYDITGKDRGRLELSPFEVLRAADIDVSQNAVGDGEAN
ncbi:MAG: hypothetical protein ACLP8A_16640 [Methylovirgula sp.]